MLVANVDPEEIVQSARVQGHASMRRDPELHSLAYGSRYAVGDIPKFAFPEESSPASVAYQLVHDEMQFDGNPLMNCASFVHTWMEPEAEKLIMENINKNLADQDEYPATQLVHARCISYLANLWKTPKGVKAVGTATTGSSEGIFLGGLAMKWRWRARRQKEGKDASKPNIVFGANAQVALEKFARYSDVEARLVPVSSRSHFALDADEALKLIDGNTIGMFVILGSTYTGHFEPVARMAELLDDLQARTGIDVPIHVDAASGGFIAPFVYPDLKWSFELPRVVSINASGHKFGLVYPGVGWVLWREEANLPKELIFELHYLGGSEETYTLNFSRPACQVIGQYYNFIRLGRQGYTRIAGNGLANARLLSRSLEKIGVFEVLSDIHRPKGESYYTVTHPDANDDVHKVSATPATKSPDDLFQKVQAGVNQLLKDDEDINRFNAGLPVVTFKFTPEFKAEYPLAHQSALSLLLRVKGWIVPNYELPPHCADVQILRVVVREGLSEDMIDQFIRDLVWALKMLTEAREDVQALLCSKDPVVSGAPMDPIPQAQLSHNGREEVSPTTLTERDQSGKHLFLTAKLDKMSDYAKDRLHARKNWKEAFAWARENLTNARDSAWKRAHRKGIPLGEHTLGGGKSPESKAKGQASYSGAC